MISSGNCCRFGHFLLIKKMLGTHRVTVLIRLLAPAALSAHQPLPGLTNSPICSSGLFLFFSTRGNPQNKRIA
jgi:hypothetical protein